MIWNLSKPQKMYSYGESSLKTYQRLWRRSHPERVVCFQFPVHRWTWCWDVSTKSTQQAWWCGHLIWWVQRCHPHTSRRWLGQTTMGILPARWSPNVHEKGSRSHSPKERVTDGTTFPWNYVLEDEKWTDTYFQENSPVLQLENRFQNQQKTFLLLSLQGPIPEISTLWCNLQVHVRWVQPQLHWLHQEILGKETWRAPACVSIDWKTIKWLHHLRSTAAREVRFLSRQENFTWRFFHYRKRKGQIPSQT